MDIEPTPSFHALPTRLADFSTLAESLDYAARGETGFNFYDSKVQLKATLPYAELRRRALALARKLVGLGLSRGDRIAAIAETDPHFTIIFFACQYAGLVPVPLPISLNLGGHRAYVDQLRELLKAAGPVLATAPEELLPFLEEAAEGMSWLPTYASDELEELPDADVELVPSRPDEVAYIQFTSGSTSFPRGVVIRHETAMSNLQGIVRTGIGVQPGDRAASWLPFYHDMGLVGFLLGPVVSQVPVDYIRTRGFALRPVSWLRLISQNRATIAFGPPIAYQLCSQRLRREVPEGLDLSCWRVAGVGAEMIRLEVLSDFADRLEPAGFDRRAFMPCYGLAESMLAVTFSPLEEGARHECVDADVLAEDGVAVPAGPATRSVTEIVNCGQVLPGHELRIVDEEGRELGEREIGRIMLRGPSVMDEYLEDPEATAEVFDDEGWLDTGDLGYVTEEGLFVTGRTKDLIIINGRNIWPQDLEYLAEQEDAVRVGDASAFSVTDPDGGEAAVLVVQCRLTDPQESEALVARIEGSVYEHLGLRCIVDLVPPGTLPKTSSGKLSRVEAKRGFLERSGMGRLEAVGGPAGA